MTVKMPMSGSPEKRRDCIAQLPLRSPIFTLALCGEPGLLGMLLLDCGRRLWNPATTRRSRAASGLSSVRIAPTVFCYQHPCQVSQVPREIKMDMTLVVKREAVTKRAFHQNR